MHRYLARALACLAIALALSLLAAVAPRAGKKEVRLRTDGQTADIVAAVEALKRSDISIKVSPDSFITNPVGSVIAGTISLALVLWLSSGLVKRIEEWVSTLTPEKKEAIQSSQPTSLTRRG
jgi:hypothetical protein